MQFACACSRVLCAAASGSSRRRKKSVREASRRGGEGSACMVTEEEKGKQQEEEEEKGDNRRSRRSQSKSRSKRERRTDNIKYVFSNDTLEEPTSRPNSEPPSTKLTRRHCVLPGRAPDATASSMGAPMGAPHTPLRPPWARPLSMLSCRPRKLPLRAGTPHNIEGRIL